MKELNRKKYYLVSEDDWYVGIDGIDSVCFVSDIERAISYYDKKNAEKILDICKEKHMNVKIIQVEIQYKFEDNIFDESCD